MRKGLRARQRCTGHSSGRRVHVVTQAVQQLYRRRQPPIVLHVEGVRPRVVRVAWLPEELCERRIRERSGTALRRQVGFDRRERIELELGLRACVVDGLDAGAELVRVVRSKHGEVIGEAEDAFREAKSGIGSRSDRTAKVRDAADVDRRPGARERAGTTRLRASRILHASFVQQAVSEGRNELARR